MRRWLRRLGIGLAVLVASLASVAWYLSTLPWRNRCGDAPVAAAIPSPSPNSAVATSQPLATKAAADVLTAGGSAADAAGAAAFMLFVVGPGNSGVGGGGVGRVRRPQTRGGVPPG